MSHRPSKKNMRSTNPIYEEDSDDTPINKTGDINILAFEGIEMMVTPEIIFTYQTVLLPVTFFKGTKYLFVLYCYDTNAILTEPFKDRKVKYVLRASKKVHDELTNSEFKQETHRLSS